MVLLITSLSSTVNQSDTDLYTLLGSVVYSVNAKPTHKYLCSAQEAVRFIGVVFSSLSSFTLKPVSVLLHFLSCCLPPILVSLIVLRWRRVNPAGSLLWPLRWRSPNRSDTFVRFAFLTGLWNSQWGGILLPIDGMSLAIPECDNGPHMVVLTKTWGWALPPLLPTSQWSVLLHSLLSESFLIAWALLQSLSSNLGSQCLDVHSHSFVLSSHNMPPTSIPEMH